MAEELRLQAYMADCGVASRRKSEQIILDGRVKVNGDVITELGVKVKKGDIVYVDDKLIQKEELVYYVLNKPSGYVSTVKDEHNRKTILSLFSEEDCKKRIFPVGRLDYDTQGVILVTNDGALAERLTNPNSNIEKEYLVRVQGIIDQKSMLKLIRGVTIDGYKTKRAKCELVSIDKKNNSSLITLVITEGKNHQVKKMCEAVGFPVKKLTRVRFGTISTNEIKRGEYRALKIHEIKQLYCL